MFEGKRGPKPLVEHREPERLHSAIGKLKMERDWLKKSLGSACRDKDGSTQGRRWPWSTKASRRGYAEPRCMRIKGRRWVDADDLVYSRLIDEECPLHDVREIPPRNPVPHCLNRGRREKKQ